MSLRTWQTFDENWEASEIKRLPFGVGNLTSVLRLVLCLTLVQLKSCDTYKKKGDQQQWPTHWLAHFRLNTCLYEMYNVRVCMVFYRSNVVCTAPVSLLYVISTRASPGLRRVSWRYHDTRSGFSFSSTSAYMFSPEKNNRISSKRCLSCRMWTHDVRPSITTVFLGLRLKNSVSSSSSEEGGWTLLRRRPINSYKRWRHSLSRSSHNKSHRKWFSSWTGAYRSRRNKFWSRVVCKQPSRHKLQGNIREVEHSC